MEMFWQQTKAQIKQRKSRLLIYDEHLKRFVSADELLIPSETFKVNKVGGSIIKRKSKDLLYDLLLKKFVNTKLDIFSHGGKDDHPSCKINSLQKKYENISTSNRDFFWGKGNSGKKHRVPALPPVDRKPPTKEEDTTNTGWAGQRTIDPETDPRPELRTSGDCPLGPGKRPDKKTPSKKKNTRKMLIVCAKDNHKITEMQNASVEKANHFKTKLSDSSTIYKPKDQVQNSKVSVVKSQDCIKKVDNIIKSRVLINEKHHSDLSTGHTNPCLHNTGETVTASNLHSDDVSKRKSIEQLKCNTSKMFDDIKTQKPSTKGKCINNKLKTPDIGLNNEKTGKFKELSVITSDRAMTKYESSKICGSSKKDTCLKCSYNKDENENNKVCVSITTEYQNSKVNKPVSGKNLQKQTLLKVVPNSVTKCDSSYNEDVNKSIKFCEGITTELGNNSTINKPLSSQNAHKPVLSKHVPNIVTKCGSNYKDENNTIFPNFESEWDQNRKINEIDSDKKVCKPFDKEVPQKIMRRNSDSNVNFNFSVSPKGKKVEQCFKSSELIKKVNCSETNVGQKCTSSAQGNKDDFFPISNCIDREPITVKTEPLKIVRQRQSKKPCLRQPDLSNSIAITNEPPKPSCLRQPDLSNSITVQTDPPKPSCLRQPDLSNLTSVKTDSHKPSCLRQPDFSNSITVKTEPLKPSCVRQPDLSNNNNCSCKEGSKFSKTPLKKGLEFGLKNFQEPTTVCSVENKNPNDKTKNKLIERNKADKKFSATTCLTINKFKHCGIDSQVTENLKAITQDKCLNELSCDNDLSKIKGECYMGFKIKKSFAGLSDMNKCKNARIVSNLKEIQGEECKKSSRDKTEKIKKSKNKTSKGGKKLKKSPWKDVKNGFQEDCLCKEDKKEVISKQEQSCDTQIKNGKPNMFQEKHVAKRNKHKLEIIKTLSINMSSRHSKDIQKKCKHTINLKSNTKDSKNRSSMLSHVETQEREVLSERKGLKNKIELKLKGEDQLLKHNHISSKMKPITKNIHDPVTEKQPSQARLKQTQSELTANICIPHQTPSNTKSKVSLKPIQKKEMNKSITDHRCKVRLKRVSNNSISMIKSSRKCNICSVKNESNQSSNKEIKQTNLLGKCEATQNDNKKTSNSKATSPATQKLKKQNISYFSGLNLHSGEIKTLSTKEKTEKLSKLNVSQSEKASYKTRKNYTLRPHTTEENRVHANQSNQTKNKMSCNSDNERNSLKTPLYKGIQERYTGSHDLPGKNVSNQSLNKEIKQANLSGNCKATKNDNNKTSHSKATSPASQKLKKQSISYFSGLNLHSDEIKTLSTKEKPEKLSKLNASQSEKASYKIRKNYTLRPHTMEENRVHANQSNQTKNEMSCNSDNERNSLKTPLSKGTQERYTGSHDFPVKNVSNQSSNKQIKRANISDTCKATTNVTKKTLNLKATSLASQKLKKQDISHFSGLNLHSDEMKTLSIKANPEKLSPFNMSKSERGSYKIRKNNTLRPHTVDKNRVLVNVSNQANNEKGCNRDNDRNSQKPQLLASLAAGKGVSLHSSMVKSSCNTVKINKPNIVSIKAYTDNHDLTQNCENHLFNCNINKLPFLTKYTSGSPIPKKTKGSQSEIIVKPKLTKNMAKKSKSSTIVDMGNDVATAVKRKRINNMCKKNLSLPESYKDSLNNADTKNPKNVGSHHTGGIVNKISPTNSLLGRLKNKTEDNITPVKVEMTSRSPQEKHNTAIMDLIKIENKETDRNLIRLAGKNPSIQNKTIENVILPFVSKVHLHEILRGSTRRQKCNIAETNTAMPKKPSKVKNLLKDNISFKASTHIDDQLQKGIKQDYNNNKISEAQSMNCSKKDIKSTTIRVPFLGHNIQKSSVLKSNTFTVLSSMAPKANVVKSKTFTIKSSKIPKTNVLKTKTFTVISSRSSKEGKQVMCKIKKP